MGLLEWRATGTGAGCLSRPAAGPPSQNQRPLTLPRLRRGSQPLPGGEASNRTARLVATSLLWGNEQGPLHRIRSPRGEGQGEGCWFAEAGWFNEPGSKKRAPRACRRCMAGPRFAASVGPTPNSKERALSLLHRTADPVRGQIIQFTMYLAVPAVVATGILPSIALIIGRTVAPALQRGA